MSVWDWTYVWEAFPYLYRGALVTIQATLIGFAIALVLGLVFALVRRSPNRLVSVAMAETVEFIRSTPLLLQVFFVYFVGPQFGIVIPAWIAGIGVLGIHYAAYCSEVYRAGIEAVEGGQWEACIALNLSRSRTWRAIILPQAIPPVVPALGNYFIGMFKDTSLVYIIGMFDLLGIVRLNFSDSTWASAQTPATGLIFAGFVFWIFCFGMSRYSMYMERRLDTGHRR